MAQWNADRYSQLSDNDHHTIVTTRLVARVLPGFECRSGVRGHFVGRCLSHELGNDSRLGPPSSDCTSYFAWEQSGTARHLLRIAILCRLLLPNSAGSPYLGGFLLELSTDVAASTFVESVETPCRAEWNCGRERLALIYSFTSALRAALLSLAANAIDGGSKPRRFCDAEGHTCISSCINKIPCSMSKRLSEHLGAAKYAIMILCYQPRL